MEKEKKVVKNYKDKNKKMLSGLKARKQCQDKLQALKEKMVVEKQAL